MLLPIGQVTKATPNGTLPRLGEAPTGFWLDVVSEISELAQSIFHKHLLSVAIRGSAARNAAIVGVSDLDILAIVDDGFEDNNVDKDVCSTILPELDIDGTVTSRSTLLKANSHSWVRFSLAYSGWTVWGEDIVASLPAPKLAPHCVGHLDEFERWISTFKLNWETAENNEQKREICRWQMKTIIRSLFESAMFKEWGYTRDIYPCALVSARYFPGSADHIWHAAELAVNPVSELAAIARITEHLTPVLAKAKSDLKAQFRERKWAL